MMRRWQNRNEPPSHADDWLITYADMITLLLCFFVVFVIVSAAKKNLPQKEPVQQAVEKVQAPTPVQLPPQPLPPQILPKQPEIFQGDMPFHDITQADLAEDETTEAPPIKAEEPPAPAPVVKTDEPPQVSKEILAATLSDIASDLKSMGSADFEQKGDRITTLEMSSAAFFDSGLAVLSEAGKSILRNVATNLKADQYQDYQITVEGHTDDTPIHTAQFPSNWELSTARASAVVHFFLEQGLPAQRLRAAGYADTFPKAPNRDASGNPIPSNQAQNRRVIIKLEKIEKNGMPGSGPGQ